jgi:PAS domain S-box-containing protein
MAEPKKILVVDDELLILRIISDILSGEGYEVRTASSCDKAIQLLKNVPFHAVLTDIRMPEKNGIDLLESVRELNPNLPVILMTGFASIETAIEAVKKRAFDYLTKPLDYNKLKSVIKNAVERYELIEENRRLLQELKELNANLELKVKERNRELENIMNSTHESIITTDRDLVIKSANSKTLSIFGDYHIGKKLSDIIQNINFVSVVPHILKDPFYTSKHEIKYGDKFLEVNLSPLVDFESHEIFGVVAVVEDITDKKKLEAQLIQSAKMSAVGQLAAGIAHEFSNILSAVLGYTGLAMSRNDLEQIKKDLKVVEKASNRAVDILKKLLSFSRRGEENFQLALIDEVIEDALALVEHTFEKEGIRIVRHYGRIPPIRMNPGEIQQVILNLAINSKHAMPEGGVIAINVELEGDYVKIDFSDTGVGISKENLPRIFEPFFTTKGNSGEKGVGLGLSMVYAIIERHDGKISVSSEVGKGTTFTIMLPNIQRLSDTERERSERSLVGKRVQTTRKGNILVVDSEQVICEVIREFLSQAGHNVLIASTNESAIELIKNNHFDIVFLNLGRPERDWLEVIREIKNISPDSAVVILSGRSEDGIVDRVMSEGIFSFINKPFTLPQIQDTVARILGTG